jgi:hypothetical protein
MSIGELQAMVCIFLKPDLNPWTIELHDVRPNIGLVFRTHMVLVLNIDYASLYNGTSNTFTCFMNLKLQIGGSGVLVSKLTYIFNEETPRWRQLLSELGM